MSTENAPSRTRTVLIAEDNDVHRRTLELTMKKAGWEVSSTGHGPSALRSAVNHPFDLVITDQRLPEMEGTEIVKRLRDLNIMTPVVMVSSWANYALQQQAKAVGIARVLPSPVNPTALIQIVNRVMSATL